MTSRDCLARLIPYKYKNQPIDPEEARTTALADTDKRELRGALGQFATGVTIITTSGDDGQPVGVTANSFNSVSLDPPLVLWSLCHSAHSRPLFERAEHFCVHFLTAEQRELSERFACAGMDKFAGLEWATGIGDVPLLTEYVAQFECRMSDSHRIGDHVVFIGEVLSFRTSESRPLVFYGGTYAQADRRRKEKPNRRALTRAKRLSDRRKP
jgi:3-hydroxy-9,10-secoandrosta-1,3,5(10)-triene-9,17-dione monooxygenase reductase component